MVQASRLQLLPQALVQQELFRPPAARVAIRFPMPPLPRRRQVRQEAQPAYQLRDLGRHIQQVRAAQRAPPPIRSQILAQLSDQRELLLLPPPVALLLSRRPTQRRPWARLVAEVRFHSPLPHSQCQTRPFNQDQQQRPLYPRCPLPGLGFLRLCQSRRVLLLPIRPQIAHWLHLQPEYQGLLEHPLHQPRVLKRQGSRAQRRLAVRRSPSPTRRRVYPLEQLEQEALCPLSRHRIQQEPGQQHPGLLELHLSQPG